MSANLGDVNGSSSYPNSQAFSFTPTPSPLPGQKAESAQFNGDFTNFLQGQQTVPQLQDKYSNKYNVPFLQGNAQQQSNQLGTLGNQMQALPASVNSASQNSLLTSGQKDKVVSSQFAPIQQAYNQTATSLGQTNQALGTATQNVNQSVGQEQAQQMKMAQPWLQKYDTMAIQHASANTQWNQTNQWELNRLIDNQQAGVQMSEGQQNRMEQLAQQENGFQNNLTLLEKQASYYKSKSFQAWGGNNNQQGNQLQNQVVSGSYGNGGG